MNPGDTVKLAKARSFVLSGAAKSIREANRLSYRDVARAIGSHPSTILRWERGDRLPHGAGAIRYWDFMVALMDEPR
jgi:DNA-binding transcriptional regulator YiaG